MTVAADTTSGKIAGREKEGVPLSMSPASIPCDARKDVVTC